MTGKELYDLYLTGVPIHIEFKEDILDLDLQFETGMFAIIIEMHKDLDETYLITVDESFYRKINLSLEKPINLNSNTKNYDLKWSEIHERTDTETLYVDENYDILNFKVIKNSFNDLIVEFQKSDETSYIDWLQEQLCYYKQLYDKTN